MDSATENILFDEFEALRIDLVRNYTLKGMKTTGAWEQGLEVVVKENKATLWGLEYSRELETGRKPGKQPPSAVIEKWIVDKGIAARIEGEISISSLAYLIARKIARKGWKREEYGGVELISSVITPERMQKIINRISDEYRARVASEVIKFLKQAA